MKKIITYTYLTLAGTGIFLLGSFATETIHNIKIIESYIWITTTFLTGFFLGAFLDKHKRL